MSLRETLRTIRSNDSFTQEMAAAMTFPRDPGAEFGSYRPSRNPHRRGPQKQFTASIDAPVTEDVDRKIRRAANRRDISRAALVRQIFDSWLKSNPEAWQ
jgi:ribosome-binding protein aMBF1 (putative translation factor)